MNRKNVTLKALLVLSFVLFAHVLTAQVRYEKGALYGIFVGANGTDVVSVDNQGNVVVQKADAANPSQYWQVEELSGSVRLVNPFRHLAIRSDEDGLLKSMVLMRLNSGNSSIQNKALLFCPPTSRAKRRWRDARDNSA